MRKSGEGSQGGSASGELGRASQPLAQSEGDRASLLSAKDRGNRLFESQLVRAPAGPLRTCAIRNAAHV